MNFERINVVGSSGSGKSTLGRQIAESLDIPYVELDEIQWRPNWTESTDEQLFGGLERALAGDQWVLDGNYSRTEPIKWARVQQIVWLDLPYWRVFYQVFTRTIKRAVRREILWAGNRESLRKAFFSKDSILWWCLTNLARVRSQYETAMSNPELSHIHFVRLQTRSQIRAYLDSLKGG